MRSDSLAYRSLQAIGVSEDIIITTPEQAMKSVSALSTRDMIEKVAWP